MKPLIAILTVFAMTALVGVVAGCGSNAETVSKNISKECDKFNCLRKIVLINGFTDKVESETTGLCSIDPQDKKLVLTCKEPGDGKGKSKPVFKKHYLGLSNNTIWTSIQLQSLDVSQYRTKIIFRPTSIVPDFDLVTGDQG